MDKSPSRRLNDIQRSYAHLRLLFVNPTNGPYNAIRLVTTDLNLLVYLLEIDQATF